MSLWNLLFPVAKETPYVNTLHEKIDSLFPNRSEKEKISLACIAGLSARVAYVDFEIHPKEREQLSKGLSHWVKLEAEDAKKLTELTFGHMTELAGLDARDYCTPLIEILSIDERFEVLKSLFQMAASDGVVNVHEANEIRYISRGMLLEQKYFLSAQVTVIEHLGALLKDDAKS